MNTDGRWCFLVMHVALAPPAAGEVNWKLFKQRLEALCMPANAWAILQRRNSSAFEAPSQRAAFLLQISSTGHTGFLHGTLHGAARSCAYQQPSADLITTLWELDVVVFRSSVSTTPSLDVLNLFWICDNAGKLPDTHRYVSMVHAPCFF